MTEKHKFNNHILWGSGKNVMQERFLFFDTETSTKEEDGVQVLSFKLGSAIFWDRANNVKKELGFHSLDTFWDFVLESLGESKELLVFAHNTGFDLKIVDGFYRLNDYGFEPSPPYVNGTVFMMSFRRGNQVIHFWDTMNYSPGRLEDLGRSVGLPKLEVDFEKCDDEELMVYCLRDTEIIYRFIRQLVQFLMDHGLSRMRGTAGSLSMASFRGKFYNRNKLPIFIHDWKQAIKLERSSYRGGITDCFQVGRIPEDVYKLDINSMYPSIMKEQELPIALEYWSNESDDVCMDVYRRFKQRFGVIADVTFTLPKEYAYILTKKRVGREDKMVFAYGELRDTFCTPELEFIEKYGEIIAIHEIALYDMANIYRDFVDFFHTKRLLYKDDGNRINEQICKLILNSQYGKWGQKKIDYKLLETCDEYCYEVINVLSEEGNKTLAHIGNKIYSLEQTDENTKDSFVAISSFITSYARMTLVNYIIECGRENVFYCDTDSLFVNLSGFERLNGKIDSKKLGYLKLEGISDNVVIVNPKHYYFDEKMKCKGVKRDAIIVEETETSITFQQQQWEKYRTSFKNGNLDKQLITVVTKEIQKAYTKGIVVENNRVEPFPP